MADQKISQLTGGGAAQATDEYVVARAGGNNKITGANVAAAATSVGTLSSLTVSGDLTVDTSTLKVNSTDNRVGVGTAAPGHTFHIFGPSALLESNATNADFLIGDGTVRYYSLRAVSGGGSLQIRNHTSNTTLATIDSTGNLAVDTNTLYVDAANNRVGIGTASPTAGYQLDVIGRGRFAPTASNYLADFISPESNGTFLQLYGDNSEGALIVNGTAAKPFNLYVGGSRRLQVDTSGNLGLGVTPSAWQSDYRVLDIGLGGNIHGRTASGDISLVANLFRNTSGSWRYKNAGGGGLYIIGDDSKHYWYNVATGGAQGAAATLTQAMTLDASGNLLVGAASGSAVSGTATVIAVRDVAGANVASVKAVGGNAATQIELFGSGSTTGVYTSTNHPMLFATNNTERARITSGGDVLVGTTDASPVVNNVAGINLQSAGVGQFSSDGNPGLQVNRKASDGDLVIFRQDATQEGSISVSGNTVSYNAFAGSHWSQLEDGSKPEILRGTVMEAINELCEWPGEQNERLPKAKVSDTAESKKVYGVFMAWDNDWTETNDMYVTAVGAFICRVAADVVVEQGDLLESNGDGTARVQTDDVIRSSTIGKVTSTVKTHEYEDGTYCVPTVLYCG